MKLIYITSKKFPSTKTDPFYVRSMAEAFSELLDTHFLFLVRGEVPDDLKRIHTESVKAPRRFRMVFYFFWMPMLILMRGWSNQGTVFLSYDPNLLVILIFWRKIFRFKYSICSDWHQLFDDWRDRYVARGSDCLTTTSQRLKGLLSSVCGIAPAKILVAYGGVNTDLFIEKSKTGEMEYRKKLALPNESFLVGYVGAFKSMGMDKGLHTMIRALPHLNEKIAMVFVGGSKAQIDEYRSIATELQVEKRCMFLERQKPFEKVVEYMLAMDVLVIPYPDQHHFRDYGFPMKVWEYMSAGRPIVYSNLEIIGEVLGGRATPFKPDSPESLAQAISTLSHDVVSAEKIAKENPTAVLAYTWKERAGHIIRFIGEQTPQ